MEKGGDEAGILMASWGIYHDGDDDDEVDILFFLFRAVVFMSTAFVFERSLGF